MDAKKPRLFVRTLFALHEIQIFDPKRIAGFFLGSWISLEELCLIRERLTMGKLAMEKIN